MHLPEFGSTEPFWISGSSPVLSSVGRRVAAGYSFVWPAHSMPYFVSPQGFRITLAVHEHIPYLEPGHALHQPVPVQASDLLLPPPTSVAQAGAVEANSLPVQQSTEDLKARCSPESHGAEDAAHERRAAPITLNLCALLHDHTLCGESDNIRAACVDDGVQASADAARDRPARGDPPSCGQAHENMSASGANSVVDGTEGRGSADVAASSGSLQMASRLRSPWDGESSESIAASSETHQRASRSQSPQRL